MLKILAEPSDMELKEKCEFIAFLCKNYPEIDYNFLQEWSDLKISTLKSYRSKGLQTLTKHKEELFSSFVQRVEKKQRNTKSYMVYYDNENDLNSYGDKVPTTYICEIYKGDNLLYTKIGKSIHLHDRMKNHSINQKYGSDSVTVKKVYAFDDEEESLIMESLIRKYLKNIYKENFIRNDRFSNIKITEQDREEIEKLYNKMFNGEN